MTSVRTQLLEMILDPDTAFDQPMSDIAPLQLRAAQELFEQRRTQIPLLNRRAEEAGIASIKSLQDIVPLLFAHTVYKSYPPSFVEQGRWDRMLQWLNTLSVDDVSRSTSRASRMSTTGSPACGTPATWCWPPAAPQANAPSSITRAPTPR